MGEVTIITNNVPRLVIDAYELTEAERKDFDYIDWQDMENNDAEFVRYKGTLYDLSEFMVTPPMSLIKEWDGYKNDTFFSGILIKYHGDEGDYDHVVMGRYFV